MIATGIFLLALGIADLAAGGLAGIPRDSRRSWLGIAAGSLTAFGAALPSLPTPGGTALFVLVSTISTGCWILLRTEDSATSRAHRTGWALAALGAGLVTVVTLSGALKATPPAGIQAWLDSLPFPVRTQLTAGEVPLLLGLAIFLTASANGIVRAVLTVAGNEFGASDTMKGGRFIGPIERYLILGLALSGQPTAAALIVSAKSILRFPELTRAEGVQPGADSITEYFLLGSLTSWFLALAPVLLLR